MKVLQLKRNFFFHFYVVNTASNSGHESATVEGRTLLTAALYCSLNCTQIGSYRDMKCCQEHFLCVTKRHVMLPSTY